MIEKVFFPNGKLMRETNYSGENNLIEKICSYDRLEETEIKIINDNVYIKKRKFFSNGNIERETPFYNGKVHGIEKTYYSNGKKYIEQAYVNGVTRGIIRSWNLNSEKTFFYTRSFTRTHGIYIKFGY